MFASRLMDAHPEQLWVQRLSARYHAFLPEDVVNLCVMCHEEMHQRYLPYIRAITYGTGRRIQDMSETDVENYKAHLTKFCKRTIKDGFVVRASIVKDYYEKIAAANQGSNPTKRSVPPYRRRTD